MNRIQLKIALSFVTLALLQAGCSGLRGDLVLSEEEQACGALTGVLNLAITSAEWVPATDSTPPYCYVRGIIWELSIKLSKPITLSGAS